MANTQKQNDKQVDIERLRVVEKMVCREYGNSGTEEGRQEAVRYLKEVLLID
jgi:hypothetical protein